MSAQHATNYASVLRISADRRISAVAADYARERICHALAFAPEPILSARVRLTAHRDPVVQNPIVAQANVNMEGRAVRAQIAATTVVEAVDLLEARLERRLDRLARHWEAVRGRTPNATEWRHGGTPRSTLPYYPRPAEQREVLRHKTFAVATATCDEAAFDMEMLDYTFHLFTESGSGVDSVLYRHDDRYRLAQLDPRPGAVTRGLIRFTVSPAHAIRTTVPGAVERLELTGWPFVFFQEGGRGRVLYHRYDGHYGLLTPAA